MYSKKEIEELRLTYENLNSEFTTFLEKSEHLVERISTLAAQDYLQKGFKQRLNILKRCIENVFSRCSPSNPIISNHDDISDLTINFQAFVINMSGAMDNLAWILKEEKKITCSKENIGLFKSDIKENLSPEFRLYLSNLGQWHHHYQNLFRHCTAHRIPPFIPRFVSEERANEYRNYTARLNSVLKQCLNGNYNNQELIEVELEGEGLQSSYPFIFLNETDQGRFPEKRTPDEQIGVEIHTQMLTDWKILLEVFQHVEQELQLNLIPA